MKFSLSMFTVAVAASAAAFVDAATPLAGAQAPDFVLKSVAGNNIRLSEHRSDIVMLVFTASWCSDCRDLDKHLAALHSRYRDAGLVLLAVSLDSDSRGAAAVAARYGIDVSVLHDAAGEAGRLYDVDELPTFALIDRGGVVRDVYAGHRRGDERSYLARVRELLREL